MLGIVRLRSAGALGAVALVAIATFAGCVTETVTPGKRTVKTTTGGQSAKPQAPEKPSVSISEAVGAAADPCADRLHALSGPLLLYYHVHRTLPERLEQLEEIAGPDPDIAFTCPVSGKSYVYNLKGLPGGTTSGTIVGGKGLLVIYDPEPSHKGNRWAVSAEKPRNAAQPLVTHVVAVPEKVFQAPPPLNEAVQPPPAPAK